MRYIVALKVIKMSERVYDKYQRDMLLTKISGKVWRCRTTGQILILKETWVDYGICLFYFIEHERKDK